ncbi:hypothetical protein ABZ904_47400 [Streptomyces sp. NPDC046900]|uniref:hypothetical protein n=1 Tax=Streptomyces sp. NPDC046900 TaxID=3155473 RepID=UPI0033ECBC4D
MPSPAFGAVLPCARRPGRPQARNGPPTPLCHHKWERNDHKWHHNDGQQFHRWNADKWGTVSAKAHGLNDHTSR